MGILLAGRGILSRTVGIFGIHACPAPLTRLERRIALERLLDRFPNPRLAVDADELRWRRGLNLRVLESLPVALA